MLGSPAMQNAPGKQLRNTLEGYLHLLLSLLIRTLGTTVVFVLGSCVGGLRQRTIKTVRPVSIVSYF
jgi:hypothetical protein